jgi:hypothetical protein
MTTETTYFCNGCGEQKHSQPTAEMEHDLRDVYATIPEDWSSLTLSVFGTSGRMNSRHYCPVCTPHVLAILNNMLPADLQN